MPHTNSNRRIWLSATGLFIAGVVCIIYSFFYENNFEKKYVNKVYFGEEIDTTYTPNCNFKYQILYDTLHVLNHTVISEETFNLLEESDNAQKELESNKSLSIKEKTKLTETAKKGDSIRNDFKKRGLYYDVSKTAKDLAENINNNSSVNPISLPEYNTVIKEQHVSDFGNESPKIVFEVKHLLY